MATRRGPDNSVRVAISGTANTINWANVFHAQLTTSATPSQADLDAWTTSFQAAYKTRFASQVSNSAAFQLAKTVLFLPGGSVLESTIAMTGTGSGGTIVQENAACAVISWLSGVYWRGGKPRTYLPTIPNTFITNAHELTTAAITSVTAAGVNFRTDVNALTSGAITASSLGFVSFRSGNADRPVPLFFACTGAKVHTRLGSQRRRIGKWEN